MKTKKMCVLGFFVLFMVGLISILTFQLLNNQDCYADNRAQDEFSIMSYNLRYKSDGDSDINGVKVSNSIDARAPRVANNIK